MIQYIAMQVSVIIPTLNAGSLLKDLLSGLLVQDPAPSEIIIIDSSSEDNTRVIAQQYGAKVILLPGKTFDHGKTRNRAAAEARGDILVFMTQDALPADNHLLATLTVPLRKPSVAAAYGRHRPRPDASPLEVFARRFNYPDEPSEKCRDDIPALGIKTFFFSNVCSAIRKELFLEAGMFPEGIRSNEDMVIAAKLIMGGYRIAYVPGATVIHSHRTSLLRQFSRYYNIASSLRNNRWILEHARPEGEGARFLKEQVRFVLGQRKYAWLPYILLESLAKYAGYRTGLLTG